MFHLLTRKFLTIYGIIGIVVMAVSLLLIWFKLVPSEYYLPLFIGAFAIWISRLVMRLMLVRKERREDADDTQPTKL